MPIFLLSSVHDFSVLGVAFCLIKKSSPFFFLQITLGHFARNKTARQSDGQARSTWRQDY